MSLHLIPVRQRTAAAFVREWHRHHQPPPDQVFAIGAADNHGVLRAVAIASRPVARHLDDGLTLSADPDIRTCGMPTPRGPVTGAQHDGLL